MIVENNILLADYLEAKTGNIYFLPNFQTRVTKLKGYSNTFSSDELEFHYNWNWIMLVLEKIDQTRTLSSVEESYLYCVSLEGNTASIRDGKIDGDGLIIEIKEEGEYTWLGTAYKLAVEFVKWYNLNKEIKTLKIIL